MLDFQTASTVKLIQFCLDGCQGAWNALIERYQDYVYSLIIRFISSADDRKDVFQNVFLILYNNLDKLRDRGKLVSYLFQITRRESLRVGRDREKADNSLENIMIGFGYDRENDTPESFLVKIEENILVADAVKQLPRRCRVLIEELFYNPHPLSYNELAEKLKMPSSAIGPTRQRCLSKLRDILKKMGVL